MQKSFPSKESGQTAKTAPLLLVPAGMQTRCQGLAWKTAVCVSQNRWLVGPDAAHEEATIAGIGSTYRKREAWTRQPEYQYGGRAIFLGKDFLGKEVPH